MKDVYLEMLNLSETNDHVDSQAISTFIFKYCNVVVQQDDVQVNLVDKRINQMKSAKSKGIMFEQFNKLFSKANKSVMVS